MWRRTALIGLALFTASTALSPSIGAQAPGVPPQTPSTEHVDLGFELEPGWTIANKAKAPDQSAIVEVIRAGDDINNWKELFTVQRFLPSWGGSSPDETLDMLMSSEDRTKWIERFSRAHISTTPKNPQ
jgi:hypothetical protein